MATKMKTIVFSSPSHVHEVVQGYEEWKKVALKTVIALSECFAEADETIEKYSGITQKTYPESDKRTSFKYEYAATLFGIRKYAAFPTGDTDAISQMDYELLIDLIIELKRV